VKGCWFVPSRFYKGCIEDDVAIDWSSCFDAWTGCCNIALRIVALDDDEDHRVDSGLVKSFLDVFIGDNHAALNFKRNYTCQQIRDRVCC
jgi:hypothetical protein